MPKLLDLFCGAGGAAMGYHRAGFEVVGVDHKPQPNFPFEFHQADALEYIAEHGHKFDMIHASPPCQIYSVTSSLSTGDHPALIKPVRAALQAVGRPYVIENVPGAPLKNPLMLCGTMFGLQVIRHRLFETSPIIWWPPTQCQHIGRASSAGRGGKNGYLPGTLKNFAYITVCGNDYIADDGRRAMGIDWMTKRELSQAIPPAYTKWIGEWMIEYLAHLTSGCNRPRCRGSL